MKKFCSYCGSPIAENEKFCHSCGEEVVNVGNLSTSRKDILGELSNAQEYFTVRREDYDRLIRLKTEYDEDTGIILSSRIAKFGVIGLLISGGLSFFNIIVEYNFLLVLSLIAGGFFSLMIFAAIALAIYDSSTDRKRFEDYQNTRTQQENEISELHNSLIAYYNAYPDCPIAFEYSNPIDIEKISAMISSGRADNVKESIQCLIDDAHRTDMLNLQKETAENAKKAASSARRASVISTANYIKK